MIPDLDHIGIAVTDLNDVMDTMKRVFNAEPDFIEEILDQKVRIAGYTSRSTTIEYFEPISPESPVSKFLQKRGNGIHHIALKVENMENILDELDAKGLRLIDRQPRRGANNKKIAFLHPESCNSILIELCES